MTTNNQLKYLKIKPCTKTSALHLLQPKACINTIQVLLLKNMQNTKAPKIENNIIDPSGRIGRANYAAVMITTHIVFYFFGKHFFDLIIRGIFIHSLDASNMVINMKVLSIAILFVLWLQIAATAKRLRDIKLSHWLTIANLIPTLGLVITLPCLFIKSKWD